MFKLGQLALKFVDIEKVIDTHVKPALKWFTDTIMPKIKDVWENTVKPALEAFWEFLKEKLVAAWENKLKPALEALVDFFNDNIVPAIETGLETIRAFVNFFTVDFANVGTQSKETGNAITDALTPVWEFIRDKLTPIFEEIAEVVWPLIVEIWEESLKPTFQDLVDFFENVIAPAIQKLWDFWIEGWKAIRDFFVMAWEAHGCNGHRYSKDSGNCR